VNEARFAVAVGGFLVITTACGGSPESPPSAAPATTVPAVQTAAAQQNVSTAATQAARLAAVVAPAPAPVQPASVQAGGSATASGGQGNPAQSNAGTEADPDSWEYRLAILQAGRQLVVTDPLIGQFKDQLDELVPKCLDDRQHLADYTVRARQQLAQQGIQDTYLRILVSTNATIRPGSLPIKCEELFEAYAKLRLSGVSVVGLLR
jgi:hypothetical protein